MVLHFDRYVGIAARDYGWLVYGLLFAILFFEIGVLPLFFLPGDPLLFICGSFCATGALSLWATIPALFFGTVLGSLLNFTLARALGHQLVARKPRWLDPTALARTHTFYERHGGLTFLLSPYIAVVRTFAPFVAGLSDMRPTHFTSAVIAGATVWVLSLVLAGYFVGDVPLIRDNMNVIVLAGIAIGTGSLIIGVIARAIRRGRGN